MLTVVVLACAHTPRGMLQAPTAAAVPPSTVRRVSRFVPRDRIAVPPLPQSRARRVANRVLCPVARLYGRGVRSNRRDFRRGCCYFGITKGGRHARRRAPLSRPGRAL